MNTTKWGVTLTLVTIFVISQARFSTIAVNSAPLYVCNNTLGDTHNVFEVAPANFPYLDINEM